jgi:hypothetical protein
MSAAKANTGTSKAIGIVKVAKAVGLGVGTVAKLKAEMVEARATSSPSMAREHYVPGNPSPSCIGAAKEAGPPVYEPCQPIHTQYRQS